MEVNAETLEDGLPSKVIIVLERDISLVTTTDKGMRSLHCIMQLKGGLSESHIPGHLPHPRPPEQKDRTYVKGWAWAWQIGSFTGQSSGSGGEDDKSQTADHPRQHLPYICIFIALIDAMCTVYSIS